MRKNRLIWSIITLIISLSILFIPTPTIAGWEEMDVNWFEIMPKLTSWQIKDINDKIYEIWKSGWNVWKLYNAAASGMTTQEQIASWIMNRDTIMNYIVFVVKFLSQLWLLVWASFIIYAWYKYMLGVFNWQAPKNTLINAIIWVVIVIFSYAIMKILTSIIWLT